MLEAVARLRRSVRDFLMATIGEILDVDGFCDTCGVPLTGDGRYAGEQAENVCIRCWEAAS